MSNFTCPEVRCIELPTHFLSDRSHINECLDECVTLGCPALLPWTAREALHSHEAAEQGAEQAVELHYELLGPQFSTQTLNFDNDS